MENEINKENDDNGDLGENNEFSSIFDQQLELILASKEVELDCVQKHAQLLQFSK